jgi:hypothetical protein
VIDDDPALAGQAQRAILLGVARDRCLFDDDEAWYHRLVKPGCQDLCGAADGSYRLVHDLARPFQVDVFREREIPVAMSPSLALPIPRWVRVDTVYLKPSEVLAILPALRTGVADPAPVPSRLRADGPANRLSSLPETITHETVVRRLDPGARTTRDRVA